MSTANSQLANGAMISPKNNHEFELGSSAKKSTILEECEFYSNDTGRRVF